MGCLSLVCFFFFSKRKKDMDWIWRYVVIGSLWIIFLYHCFKEVAVQRKICTSSKIIKSEKRTEQHFKGLQHTFPNLTQSFLSSPLSLPSLCIVPDPFIAFLIIHTCHVSRWLQFRSPTCSLFTFPSLPVRDYGLLVPCYPSKHPPL